MPSSWTSTGVTDTKEDDDDDEDDMDEDDSLQEEEEGEGRTKPKWNKKKKKSKKAKTPMRQLSLVVPDRPVLQLTGRSDPCPRASTTRDVPVVTIHKAGGGTGQVIHRKAPAETSL